MVQTTGFQETLRKLAMIDEGFIEHQAGLGLYLARTSALDPKTAALLQLGPRRPSGPRRSAWNGAPPGHWRPARRRTRSPACCWRSLRCAGSAGSSAPLPTWRPRSAMTARPRWRNWMITAGLSAGHVGLPTDQRRSIPEAEDERLSRQAPRGGSGTVRQSPLGGRHGDL